MRQPKSAHEKRKPRLSPNKLTQNGYTAIPTYAGSLHFYQNPMHIRYAKKGIIILQNKKDIPVQFCIFSLFGISIITHLQIFDNNLTTQKYADGKYLPSAFRVFYLLRNRFVFKLFRLDERVAFAMSRNQLRAHVLVIAHARTCGNEFADDDVFLQADERVDLVFDRRLRKDARRLLERSC